MCANMLTAELLDLFNACQLQNETDSHSHKDPRLISPKKKEKESIKKKNPFSL